MVFNHMISQWFYYDNISGVAIFVGPLSRVRPRNGILALVLVLVLVVVLVLSLRSEFIGKL